MSRFYGSLCSRKGLDYSFFLKYSVKPLQIFGF